MSEGPLVDVIIPTRSHESVTLAVDSLMKQTHQHMRIHVIVDPGKGQSWTRNHGLSLLPEYEGPKGDLILFSDSDIVWYEHALEYMIHKLRAEQHKNDDDWDIGYVYGSFRIAVKPPGSDIVLGRVEWDWPRLQRDNYISTMSLFDPEVCGAHLRFDETLRRLEDWDVYLTLGEHKIRGAYVSQEIFWTPKRLGGVSFGTGISHWDAAKVVSAKHAQAPVK